MSITINKGLGSQLKIGDHDTELGNILTDKPKKTCWHCLLAQVLKELLNPVNIQVLTEVQVVSDPPKADIILLRREGKTWTQEQLDCLADGLRDTNAKRLLIEFKYTESITEDTFQKLFIYDYLYRKSEKLNKNQLQSFLVSSKTPGTDILKRFGFEPTEQKGVYASKIPFIGVIKVILLNEIADEPHNAIIKCFASRKQEKGKAFETINHHVLPSRASTALAWITIGLSRVMMGKVLDNPAITGWTPDDIVKLGKEWIESKVIEFSRQEGRQEGRQEESTAVLLRLLQRRFGNVPTWVHKKIAKADLSTLGEWNLRILDAKSLEDVFDT